MVDLLHRFDRADKRGGPFNVEFVDLDGDRRQAIFAHSPSRMIWRLRFAGHATLRTAIALRSETWNQPGDGVSFRIGISDGRRFENLFAQHVDPQHRSADRRWIPVEVDLSAYGGWQWSLFYRPSERDWELIFATDPGPERHSTTMWDWAVWAAPVIYERR